MSIFIHWIDDQRTCIHMEFVGQWTWDELLIAKAKAEGYLDEVDYPVNFIVYSQHENWMPANYSDRLLQVVLRVHPNAGLMVIVNTNPLYRRLFEVFNEVSHQVKFRFRFVNSLDDAYDLLGLEHAA